MLRGNHAAVASHAVCDKRRSCVTEAIPNTKTVIHSFTPTPPQTPRSSVMSRQQDEEYQMLMQPKPVSLVDHPDYEAPRLKTTWMQMLPRMACGCAILLVIVGGMVSVVWSVVSDAPGDPLHRKTGAPASATAIKQAALHASAKHRREAKDQKKTKSPWEWIEGVLNRYTYAAAPYVCTFKGLLAKYAIGVMQPGALRIVHCRVFWRRFFVAAPSSCSRGAPPLANLSLSCYATLSRLRSRPKSNGR